MHAEKSVGSARIVVGVVAARHAALNIGQSWPKTARSRQAPRRHRPKAVKKARSGKAAKVKPPKAQAKADAEGRCTARPSRWTQAEVEEAFRRFQAGDAGAQGRAASTSIRSRCWSPWCCRRRRPTPASTRRRRRCSRSPTRRRRWSALGEDARARATSRPSGCSAPRRRTSIALSQKLIAEHGGEVPRTREALRGAARRRPQDRQRRAQHGVRRADHRGRHAHLPRRQPHRPGARQGRRWRSS